MTIKNLSPTTIWIVFWIVAIVFIGLFVCDRYNSPDSSWILGLIGMMGSIISLLGIVLAILQIKQANEQIEKVSTIARATEEAVSKNRDEIRQFLSFSDVAHLSEVIKHAQNYILKKDYQSAVIKMQDIKDNLVRLNYEFEKLIDHEKISMTEIIKNLNIDIKSIFAHIELSDKTKSSLATLEVHTHLEAARETVISIESSLKKQKL